jgi:hypothetical protein
VYGAIVVRAYGEGGFYALAVDDDGGLSGCTRRGWLGVRVLFYRLDLAEVPALDGSGPLLSCVPPSVLDLDKLGPGRNLTVDVGGEFDLIAGSGEALIAVGYVRKEGSVVSAATGASDASSGCGVEGGIFAVEWSIRKREIEVVLNPSGYVLGGQQVRLRVLPVLTPALLEGLGL